MSDEKNTQPEIETEPQELSAEELNDVAGGIIVVNSSTSLQKNLIQGSVQPPSISSTLLGDVKGAS